MFYEYTTSAVYDANREIRVDVININGATMLRFITTTYGWAERSRNNICVPDRWPFMIVELLFGSGGSVMMSSAIGIPKASVSSLKRQGLYYYSFEDIPPQLIVAVTQHFNISYKTWLKDAGTLLETPKPRLTLVVG